MRNSFTKLTTKRRQVLDYWTYSLHFLRYIKKKECHTFGKIKIIYVVNNDVYLHLQIFISKEFNTILECYEITCTNLSKVIRFSNLQYIRPFEIHLVQSKMFLLMPHEIID